jgi:hypothetical protein
MSRFTTNVSLVRAICDGVAQMHAEHAEDGRFDTHDLINWLNDHRNSELNDTYDLYRGSDDPEMRADNQIGRFLYNLGQIKIGERTSVRRIGRRDGVDRNGECKVSVWEVSPRAQEALAEARRTFAPESTAEWLEEISGMFRDDPVFDEIIQYGREFREAARVADEDVS